MSVSVWPILVDAIRDTGVGFDVGLTDAEVTATETKFGFRFPDDLRAFLQAGLPRGKQFSDWQSGNEAALRDGLDLPLRGLLFDVEYGGFWLDEWGLRPPSLEDAQSVVAGLVASAPKLIPIFAHRMMPAEPRSAGNPVFSVHQTDIIVYGADLRDYLAREFLTRDHVDYCPTLDNVRRIAFWNIDRFQDAGM